MMIDSSAVVALLDREPEGPAVQRALIDSDRRYIAAPTLVEVGMVMEGRHGEVGRVALERFRRSYAVTVLPFNDELVGIAWRGWRAFGKGRHPAGLNFGDCITYAAAIAAGERILCVGNDFARTDAELVPLA